MITESDIMRIQAQHDLSDPSLDYLKDHITQEQIMQNGYDCFITRPIKAWGETQHKLRPVEIVSMGDRHANIEINGVFLTVMREDILIQIDKERE